MNSVNYNLVGFGTATLDYICLTDKVADYEQTVFISDLKICSGGVVPTALVAFQRLGGKSSFISTLGNDWIGNQIIKELRDEGIDYSSIEILENISSPLSFIQVNKITGDRAIAYYPGSANYLKFKKTHENLIKNSKILLLDGINSGEDFKLARFAKKNGVKVMLDAHVINENTDRLLPEVDYLITSQFFLREFLPGMDIEKGLMELKKRFSPDIIVTTLGENGSVALINNKIVHEGIFDVNVKDTTGCGDVYHGAFIFGILKKWDIKDIMVFATAVSSIKCTEYGGRKGIPDYKETMKFLNDRNIFL